MCCGCGGGESHGDGGNADVSISESESTVSVSSESEPELPDASGPDDTVLPGEGEVPSDYEFANSDQDMPLTIEETPDMPELDGDAFVVEGDAEPWSAEMGKLALDYMNSFRMDPTSIPPTQAGADEYGQGNEPSPGFDYEWNAQLYELCEQHSVNQANTGSISHDGVSERFGRVTYCQYQSWGENVAYNMMDGSAAVEMAIKQWAESVHGHRENMLNDSWDYAAVAFAELDGRVYATAKFMKCF